MVDNEIARLLKIEALLHTEENPCLAAFATSLETDPRTSIESFLSQRPAEDRAALSSLIALDLYIKLASREQKSIEDYFAQFPELRQNRDQVLDLIYAEFCWRQKLKETVESEEYYRRFPDFQDSLERLFRIDSTLGGDQLLSAFLGLTSAKLPNTGEEFLGFRLVAELGRGKFGRVFLAEQMNLGDRQVVVKVTPLRTIEHQTLARLEHPNIVPVYSVHRDDASGLQAVCMPYQNAVALSDIAASWRASGSLPRSAGVIIERIQRLLPSQFTKPSSESDSTLLFPIDQSYVYGCCWIMQRVASALQHAHLRGIYHRDLKPSNILVSANGHPLLVDFNLAFNPIESGGDAVAFFGGTLPYMPPEKIAILQSQRPRRADDIGPRSDIFSLAVTIYELLTGRLPFEPPVPGTDRAVAIQSQLDARLRQPPPASKFNPLVSSDLDAVLAKCIDAFPPQRYESTGQLAEDLQLLMQDRPLRHIGKVPPQQVLLKYLRRNRRKLATSCAMLCAAGTIAATLFVVKARANRDQTAAIEAARASHTAREHAEAALVRQAVSLQIARDARDKLVEAITDAHDEADAEIRHIIERYANDPKNRHRLPWLFAFSGYNFLKLGKHYEAIRLFDKAESSGYKHSQLYYQRGKCHAIVDDDQRALRDYSACIALDPTHALAYLGRAICFASSRTGVADLNQALSDVEKALALMPEDAATKRLFYYDAARVYSCVAEHSPAQQTTATLDRAESALQMAIDNGFSADEVHLMAARDHRFDMLNLVLKRPSVRQRLQSQDAKMDPAAPTEP